MTDFGIETRYAGGGSDTRWRVSKHGEGNGRPGTLDVSGFTDGTHYNIGRNDNMIPSGVVLKHEGGVWKAWDGTGQYDGILLESVEVGKSGKSAAAILVHGIVDARYLPVKTQRDAIVAAETSGSFVFEK